MALLHQAEIRPSKLELVRDWAPGQPWFDRGAHTGFAALAAYRFDDPEGEVGIETLLLRMTDGDVVQIPLTYRGAPLVGAEPWLITTMQHSVLGDRWVYDGTGDPAYLAAVATAARTGGVQAELIVEIDGEAVRREPTALVAGSGTDPAPVAPPALASVVTSHGAGSSIAEAPGLRVTIARFPASAGLAPRGDLLTGTWEGQAEPLPLVAVTR